MSLIRGARLVAIVMVMGCSGPERSPAGSPAATTSEPRRAALTLNASPGDQPTLSMPGGTAIVDLQIDTAASPQFASYDARVRDRAGEEVWLSDLRRPPAPVAGTLTVSIPSVVLKPGRYELTLLGRAADGRRSHFADLSFAVR